MKSNPLRKMFETDKAVEREGVVVQYAPGVEIRVARAGGGNTRFAKVISRLTKPHRRSIQTESIGQDVLMGILRRAYAEAVIVSWAGITKDLITHDDADSEVELPHSVENCLQVLTEQPNLFADIQKAADDISMYRQEVLEADAKN